MLHDVHVIQKQKQQECVSVVPLHQAYGVDISLPPAGSSIVFVASRREAFSTSSQGNRTNQPASSHTTSTHNCIYDPTYRWLTSTYSQYKMLPKYHLSRHFRSTFNSLPASKFLFNPRSRNAVRTRHRTISSSSSSAGQARRARE